MLHLRVHPDNPQPRLISQAVERIRAGDVVVYPTDAAYAIGKAQRKPWINGSRDSSLP